MKVIIPINVKMVITNNTKAKLINEIENSIDQLNIELEQLQFQHKKLIAEAKKKGPESLNFVEERINLEQQKRKDKLNLLMLKKEHIVKLTDGDEILSDTVQSEIDVSIGMVWDELYKHREIVIKEGIVVEIRDVEHK